MALVGGDGTFVSFFLGEATAILSAAVFGCVGLPEGAPELSVFVEVTLLLLLLVSLGDANSVLSIFSTVIFELVVDAMSVFSLLSIICSLVLVGILELTSAIFL